MRLTTAMWLGVFMRREAERGAYVTVVRKGAQEAGALFVIHNRSNGHCDLYGPAPQSYFGDEDVDRLFEQLLVSAELSDIDTYLEKQQRFDPDLWVIETESGSGSLSLEITR